ncbi:MAG TPA: 6-carboxytetrahydropterin synthase [Candidatus Competibacteraceae bacterium]|nr:6-carboxytetrahydropterin synthase [Candidatus Competibacteraceae bacterium]
MTERLYTVVAAPFEAARQVDILPVGHRARRLHGHSFLARIRAQLPAGWAPFPGAEIDMLAAQLAECLTPLDYALLNEHLAVPTDENLARWLRARLNVPGIEQVGIRSTRDQGADLDEHDHTHLWRRFRFEAAHRLPKVPPGHKCGRMHGHGFEIILHADQNLNGRDMGIDFDQLEAMWAPLYRELHQSCLNDISGLENPTSELLATWLWRCLKPDLPALSWITVYETISAGCHFDGSHYRIWKEQRFESALRLHQAPPNDLRHRLHGHSYLIRLHLTAPLDAIMGWTVDYGDVKALFKPVYEQLDHYRLDELAGLKDTDPTGLLRWLRESMQTQLPQLDRIDLYPTPGCGAMLCWGDEGSALPV